jgi:hypothetical protein
VIGLAWLAMAAFRRIVREGLRSRTQPDPTQGRPHFLSQAVHDGLLSSQQAQEISDKHQNERRISGKSRLAGEIASDLGYLTTRQCEEIEHAKRRARAHAQAQRDPVNCGGRGLLSRFKAAAL